MSTVNDTYIIIIFGYIFLILNRYFRIMKQVHFDFKRRVKNLFLKMQATTITQ